MMLTVPLVYRFDKSQFSPPPLMIEEKRSLAGKGPFQLKSWNVSPRSVLGSTPLAISTSSVPPSEGVSPEANPIGDVQLDSSWNCSVEFASNVSLVLTLIASGLFRT